MRKPRPLLGTMLVLSALFLKSATRCGVVGRQVGELASYLLGLYGTRLLVIALAVAGIRIALPRSAWVGVVAVARGSVRRLGNVAASVARHLARSKSSNAIDALRTQPIARAFQPEQLADLRGGLRYLGYSRPEIESVTKRLDPGSSTEKLLRDALRLLQRAA